MTFYGQSYAAKLPHASTPQYPKFSQPQLAAASHLAPQYNLAQQQFAPPHYHHQGEYNIFNIYF